MLTIRAEIKRNEQKADKTFNVKLRFTLDRSVKRISTSLFVLPKDLSKVLKSQGYSVWSTDLVDRGYGSGNTDFLKSITKKLCNTSTFINQYAFQ